MVNDDKFEERKVEDLDVMDEETRSLIEKLNLEDQEKSKPKEIKPDCKICFEQIEHAEIYLLECNHMFHEDCIRQMI